MPTTTFVLVLSSAALHACWNFAARKAAGRFGVVWLGLLLAGLAGAPFAAAGWDAATRAAWPFMLATSALNAVYFAALARAYQLGDLAEVYPLMRGTGVVGAALLAHWVLGERLGPLGRGGVVLVVAGLWLVTRRGEHARKPGDAWPWALAAGCCIFLSALVDKTAMLTARPLPYVVVMFFGAAVGLSPLAWARRAEVRDSARRSLGSAALIGVGSMTSYGMILYAMRSGPLGLIAAARESSVVFGAVLGAALLGERLTVLRAAGVLAVAGGLTLVRLA